MLLIPVLLVTFSLCYGNSLNSEPLQSPDQVLASNIKQWIGPNELEIIKPNITSQKGGIEIRINVIVDLVLGLLQKIIVKSGFDPLKLEDEVIKLQPTGTVTLTDGWLYNISTINRYDDVVIRVSAAEKKVSLSLPISFDSIGFTYIYDTKYLLLNIKGGVEGKISDIRIDMVFSFDTCNSTFAVDKFSLQDTGDFTIEFTGNELTDWLVNAMSNAIAAVVQPIIINVIETFVKTAADSIVEIINNFIHSI
ncbi:hypothetical protein GWI33_005928 [Rhynchophorus ferrugineus]|uniref:Uncharacterized protein n=1 Tax=Rhynchophorus ferrugineus TaxID=354439 RepID=A0A834MNH8_RHYFE|nr:hypothetical protein GWI33_005928 [Rhynchophorus ferrugineus]